MQETGRHKVKRVLAMVFRGALVPPPCHSQVEGRVGGVMELIKGVQKQQVAAWHKLSRSFGSTAMGDVKLAGSAGSN